MTKALMLQGTASGVGKSLLTAGLCRLLARSGVRVAPFKPQNMSNASAACLSGGEIGRAQALQAFASGLEPAVDMNPVLLKPEADHRAQLVVSGQVRGILMANRFREDRAELLPEVLAAFNRLSQEHEFVLIEGAGSPAEPNLREGDIANMGFAQAAKAPVWLVGDIDKGGVFASLLGTMDALDPTDRQLVQALVINRFRGDASLLGDACDWLTERTQRPLLGCVPYVHDLALPEEDAPYSFLGGRGRHHSDEDSSKLRVGGVFYPRASNTSDLDPIADDPRIDFCWLADPDSLSGLDLAVLPGSKAVAGDLSWLRQNGWVEALERHVRYGGRVLGLCGGLQMLGQRILDPLRIEGPAYTDGLGWLPVEAELKQEKLVRTVSGQARWPDRCEFAGYEIRHGESPQDPMLYPFAARSEDGRVMGTYVHGLFDLAEYRHAVLEEWLGWKADPGEDQQGRWLRDLDRLADSLCESLDLRMLEEQVGRLS
ncbi:cobyric acid synthase [Candidatus Poriferisocius sp.]|uniref:cobyric acid synthase n=1 Tax=Candidatus Poriferisocius sp. TaxID=3101276 RepID=UPI003B5244F9